MKTLIFLATLATIVSSGFAASKTANTSMPEYHFINNSSVKIYYTVKGMNKDKSTIKVSPPYIVSPSGNDSFTNVAAVMPGDSIVIGVGQCNSEILGTGIPCPNDDVKALKNVLCELNGNSTLPAVVNNQSVKYTFTFTGSDAHSLQCSVSGS